MKLEGLSPHRRALAIKSYNKNRFLEAKLSDFITRPEWRSGPNSLGSAWALRVARRSGKRRGADASARAEFGGALGV